MNRPLHRLKILLTHSTAIDVKIVRAKPMRKHMPPNTWNTTLTSNGTGSITVNRMVKPEREREKCLSYMPPNTWNTTLTSNGTGSITVNRMVKPERENKC